MIWCWLTFDGFFTWGNLIQMIPNDWSAVDSIFSWTNSGFLEPSNPFSFPVPPVCPPYSHDITIFHPGSVWSCIFLYPWSMFRQQERQHLETRNGPHNIKKTHLHLVHFHHLPSISSLCFSDKACRSWRQCSAASSTSRSWAKLMGIHPSGTHGSVETFRIISNRYYVYQYHELSLIIIITIM